ncbi:hypothetical protein ACHAWF_011886 [Thalassiosira exigua]
MEPTKGSEKKHRDPSFIGALKVGDVADDDGGRHDEGTGIRSPSSLSYDEGFAAFLDLLNTPSPGADVEEGDPENMSPINRDINITLVDDDEAETGTEALETSKHESLPNLTNDEQSPKEEMQETKGAWVDHKKPSSEVQSDDSEGSYSDLVVGDNADSGTEDSKSSEQEKGAQMMPSQSSQLHRSSNEKKETTVEPSGELHETGDARVVHHKHPAEESYLQLVVDDEPNSETEVLESSKHESSTNPTDKEQPSKSDLEEGDECVDHQRNDSARNKPKTKSQSVRFEDISVQDSAMEDRKGWARKVVDFFIARSCFCSKNRYRDM